MYDFVRNMWLMGRITAEQIGVLVANGRLTQEQADEIRALPRPGD